MRPARRSTSTSCATWLLIPAYKSAAASPAAVANFSVQLEPAVGVIQLKHFVELAGGNPRLPAELAGGNPRLHANWRTLQNSFSVFHQQRQNNTQRTGRHALRQNSAFVFHSCIYTVLNLSVQKPYLTRTLPVDPRHGTSVHGLRKLAFRFSPVWKDS